MFTDIEHPEINQWLPVWHLISLPVYRKDRDVQGTTSLKQRSGKDWLKTLQPLSGDASGSYILLCLAAVYTGINPCIIPLLVIIRKRIKMVLPDYTICDKNTQICFSSMRSVSCAGMALSYLVTTSPQQYDLLLRWDAPWPILSAANGLSCRKPIHNGRACGSSVNVRPTLVTMPETVYANINLW